MAHNLIWHGSRLFYKLWRALPTSVIIRASLRGNSLTDTDFSGGKHPGDRNGAWESEAAPDASLSGLLSSGWGSTYSVCTRDPPTTHGQIKPSTSSAGVHSAWFHAYLTGGAEHGWAGPCPTRGRMGKGCRSPQGGCSTTPLGPVLVGLLPGYGCAAPGAGLRIKVAPSGSLNRSEVIADPCRSNYQLRAPWDRTNLGFCTHVYQNFHCTW